MNTAETNNSLPGDIKELFARHFPELSACVADIRAMPAPAPLATRASEADAALDDDEDDGEWQPFTLQALADSPVVSQLKQDWRDTLDQFGVSSFDGLLALIAGGYQQAKQERAAEREQASAGE
jgi:hypothetical protein